jgi:hypothetical protein
MNLRLNPSRQAEKQVSNRPSYDANLMWLKLRKYIAQKITTDVFGI